MFVHLTGWRIGEANQLTWRNVDFTAGTLRFDPGTTKNDEGRTFPFVFHRFGRRIGDFRVAWHRACARAGVPGRFVHDLRRAAVRNFERAGVSRSVAMKLWSFQGSVDSRPLCPVGCFKLFGT
ncbi:MAG: hypothetical protein ABIU54_02810 [Candidatus Eisenbacteria bacterium]